VEEPDVHVPELVIEVEEEVINDDVVIDDPIEEIEVDIEGTLRVGPVGAEPESAVAEPVFELRPDDPPRAERQVSRAGEEEDVVEDEVIFEDDVSEVESSVVVQVAEPDAAAVDAEGAAVVLSGDGRDGQRQEDRRGRGRPEE